MFLRHKQDESPDFSDELRDPVGCQVGVLRTLNFPLNISSLSTEPISGLLAIGTSDGVIYLFGRPGVETELRLPEAREVKFLQFASSVYYLICLDAQSFLHVWDLSAHGRPRLLTSVQFDQVK